MFKKVSGVNGRHLKRNATGYPDSLLCEAEGLECLDSALKQVGVSGVRIPRVFRVDAHELELEAISGQPASADTMTLLGEGLAQLHAHKESGYGWGRNNYIGLAPQINGWYPSWGEFFVRQRLGYQLSRVRSEEFRRRFEQILEAQGPALADWLDNHCEHPSLLHGDLWSGNALFDDKVAWLIDPAVYCGDREADIAMTEMFGGFGNEFYKAYDQSYPRTDVYPAKREIYNLYHYLNHYNLFGGGYLAGCKRGFNQIQQMFG